MRNSPVTRDDLDVLQRTIQDLRREVQLLKNTHSPTVPVYLPDVPDDQIDGQIALVPVDEVLIGDDTVKLAWSFGGDWRAPMTLEDTAIHFTILNSGDQLRVATTGQIELTADTDMTLSSATGQVYIAGDTKVSIVAPELHVDYLLDQLILVKQVAGVWEYHIQAGSTWVADL